MEKILSDFTYYPINYTRNLMMKKMLKQVLLHMVLTNRLK